ncbi:hypothetical protein [Roseisolibacter sp. H3M3-2]|uniref:hypothetical protein n=1 Tax=Roseisolibacter sp. H3M3-2 TaxID=3031323 RepID=UPI0023DC2338|nr:hypothetical protein [Roseisolibacter sp. H3M3-2]MDF1505046.1 hypothetical protein [Roseisolibacter sp. H3M3-2]
MRVVQFRTRNPLVGLLILLVVLALLVGVVVFGAVAALALAVVGGGVMAVRRLTGRPALRPPPPAELPLDPTLEIRPAEPDDTRRLPPA